LENSITNSQELCLVPISLGYWKRGCTVHGR